MENIGCSRHNGRHWIPRPTTVTSAARHRKGNAREAQQVADSSRLLLSLVLLVVNLNMVVLLWCWWHHCIWTQKFGPIVFVHCVPRRLFFVEQNQEEQTTTTTSTSPNAAAARRLNVPLFVPQHPAELAPTLSAGQSRVCAFLAADGGFCPKNIKRRGARSRGHKWAQKRTQFGCRCFAHSLRSRRHRWCCCCCCCCAAAAP